MKTIIARSFIMLAVSFMASKGLQAQGSITYLSSLSTNYTGNVAIANDSWLAAMFGTGGNADGYLLDSVQLGMADASGNPSNFTAMIYSAFVGGAILPDNNLCTLDGSSNPANVGVYTFTTVSNLLLSPDTTYFIVATANTMVSEGAYSWSESAYPPAVGTWGAGNGVLRSVNGSTGWSPTPYLGIAQFAINATAIPEPGVTSLWGLGGLAFLWRRRKTKAIP
jgi:hypothetical protein